jgi:hypothetical protein
MRRREPPVATVAAILAGGALIATVDVDDLEHLTAHAENVRVVSIQP